VYSATGSHPTHAGRGREAEEPAHQYVRSCGSHWVIVTSE